MSAALASVKLGPGVPLAPAGPTGPGTVEAGPAGPAAPACAIMTQGGVPGIAVPAATGPVATYVDIAEVEVVPPVPIICELPAPAADSEYALSPLMLHVP